MNRVTRLMRLRRFPTVRQTLAYSQAAESKTHFGFTDVLESEKEKKVHDVFANVAEKYDLMNDAMSFGVHRLWKDYYVGSINIPYQAKILDMAGGTGDISFRFARASPSAKITVSDINQNMLDVGSKRALSEKDINPKSLEWICANAENLPFDDNTFDIFSMSFGIRNCTHVDKVLAEAFRVLKPGGQLAILEFSEVNATLKPIYDAYSFNIIPTLGDVLASDRGSYQYLVESIRKFPNQEKFAHMIHDVGFSEVTYENLTFGVCSIHKGVKRA